LDTRNWIAALDRLCERRFLGSSQHFTDHPAANRNR
jgi:hypothetical protein